MKPGVLEFTGLQRISHDLATEQQQQDQITNLGSTSPFFFFLYFTLEKAMAPHSIILAWKIPWTEEPGGLQSMGSLRVRHD